MFLHAKVKSGGFIDDAAYRELTLHSLLYFKDCHFKQVDEHDLDFQWIFQSFNDLSKDFAAWKAAGVWLQFLKGQMKSWAAFVNSSNRLMIELQRRIIRSKDCIDIGDIYPNGEISRRNPFFFPASSEDGCNIINSNQWCCRVLTAPQQAMAASWMALKEARIGYLLQCVLNWLLKRILGQLKWVGCFFGTR